jgi:pyruvate dehydrogenase E2 component (dihydrolipoamide acetyltransferase)
VGAAPNTRRLARELGLDLTTVPGSGPGGRITKDDVKNAFAQRSGGGARVALPPLPDFSQYGEIERRPLNAIGKASAKNLSLAWQAIPHVTQHDSADVTELEAARRAYVQANAKSPKITMTVLAIKAVLAVVREFPHFNASFDAATNEVVIKKHFHFGVAVDTEHGLMVPVIRDVDQKNLVQIATELTELAEKARQKRLEPAQFKGGTFTISNLGGLGGSFFTPIVNYPEVAILGVSRGRQEYVLKDGAPEFRLMLPLSLSYDHRVINGADGARFISRLSSLLASPFSLLSES